MILETREQCNLQRVAKRRAREWRPKRSKVAQHLDSNKFPSLGYAFGRCYECPTIVSVIVGILLESVVKCRSRERRVLQVQ